MHAVEADLQDSTNLFFIAAILLSFAVCAYEYVYMYVFIKMPAQISTDIYQCGIMETNGSSCLKRIS